MDKPWFQRGYRRILVDMHIADWNDEFLSKYDPRKVADLYAKANVTSAMFYCQSHVGLCYWPTQSGKMHAGLHGRDIVGQMVAELKARGIAAVAYYSLIFNNWAFLEHPQWRQKPANETPEAAKKDFGAFEGSRYGLVCPNNPGYFDFVIRQLDELVGGYKFEGIFYDMTFWPTLCVCSHCRDKFRRQTGKEIPQTVDWFNPDWVQFQIARERWMGEFGQAVTDKTKALQPGITVCHNYATVIRTWAMGVGADAAGMNDYLSGDFYGNALDQLVVCKLMANLTPNAPLEFATSRCVNLGDHEWTKSAEELEIEALAATFSGGGFMFIDAINLDGTVNPAVFRTIGKIFKTTAPYEPYLGGRSVEDFAVYFSPESRMSLDENGKTLAQVAMWAKDYPHLKAVRGLCRILQRAHLPFGVITRRQLGDLKRYKALLLPNLLRMDDHEIRAIREYVRAGGRLYASRYTSLIHTDGKRCDDFMLADVFGCHLAADDLGTVTYLKPANAAIARLIEPQRYLSHFGMDGSGAEGAGTLRLVPESDGEALATLTLPYGKEWGNISNQNWASIHSSPPWQDTDVPVIVAHPYGEGLVIYSAADIECMPAAANEALLLHLLRMLAPQEPTFRADAHPGVWAAAYHQPEHRRYVIALLNNQAQLPAIPIAKLTIHLRVPAGGKFTSLAVAPRQTPVPFTTDADGTLHADVRRLKVFQMLLAQYA